MSSLFSDPPFGRAQSLLAGETIERFPPNGAYSASNATTSGSGYPVSGREIVGQVKVFSDFNPATKQKYSNALVYCIAARYKPTTAVNLTAPGGKLVKLKIASGLESASFDENLATSADVISGERVAAIDEYFGTSTDTIIRPDDIVWLVFRGPCSIAKTNATITAGNQVSVSGTAGYIFQKPTDSMLSVATATASTGLELQSVGLGLCWGKISDDLATVTFGANSDNNTANVSMARVNLIGVNWNH